MNTQTIYGLVYDGGDGSAYMHWFRNKEKVDELLDEDSYNMNEGDPAQTLTFPADLDLEAAGFYFMDNEDEDEDED